MKNVQRIGIGAVVLAMLCQRLWSGEIVIKDDFDQAGAKVALQGRITETGDATWEATPNLVLLKEDSSGSVGLSDNRGILAKVKLPTVDNIVISAEVGPRRDAEEKGSWMAIGLGNGRGATWEGGLFFLMHDGGTLECYASPVGEPRVQIKIQRAVPVDPTAGKVKLTLQYQKSNNTVTAWVNDIAIIKNHSLGNFHPILDYAGFSGVQLKPAISVLDHFCLVVTTP